MVGYVTATVIDKKKVSNLLVAEADFSISRSEEIEYFIDVPSPLNKFFSVEEGKTNLGGKRFEFEGFTHVRSGDTVLSEILSHEVILFDNGIWAFSMTRKDFYIPAKGWWSIDLMVSRSVVDTLRTDHVENFCGRSGDVTHLGNYRGDMLPDLDSAILQIHRFPWWECPF